MHRSARRGVKDLPAARHNGGVQDQAKQAVTCCTVAAEISFTPSTAQPVVKEPRLLTFANYLWSEKSLRVPNIHRLEYTAVLKETNGDQGIGQVPISVLLNGHV